MVRRKKSLGQHFLIDHNYSIKIVEAIESADSAQIILEIGSGEGALTQFLVEKYLDKYLIIEIDQECITHIKKEYPELNDKIIKSDFLKINLDKLWKPPMVVVGNFPYNISSQILFHILDYRSSVIEVVGMFQKEVAQRITSSHGSKNYGILSVLIQAFFEVEYLFDVPAICFSPPPKVVSGVIRLKQKESNICNYPSLKKLVKMAFAHRRKTLRNNFSNDIKSLLDDELLSKRAEQLSVDDFIQLSKKVYP